MSKFKTYKVIDVEEGDKEISECTLEKEEGDYMKELQKFRLAMMVEHVILFIVAFYTLLVLYDTQEQLSVMTLVCLKEKEDYYT